MFDAKSILEALVNGAGQRPGAAPAGGGAGGGMGGLGDILGELMKGQQGGGAGGSGGGLGDILGKLGQGGGAGRSSGTGGGIGDILGELMKGQPGGGAGGSGGGLGDILGKFGQGGGAGGPASTGGGSITDILGDLLGQATQGAKDGAGRVGEATGAREALEKMAGGRSPEELMRQLKDLIGNNQLGAGTVLGGLGALILGTQTGRSVAVNAAKLGALALIGGLAYRAYQNYAQGKSAGADRGFVPDAAPSGSGFEPAAVTNDDAALYVRAMIAAAAADGRIDSAEQQRIIGSLEQVGLGRDAEEFLANELNNPATAADIASKVRSPQVAVQVYTAARIAIDPDTRGEMEFLDQLAQRLGIDANLKAHLDNAAKSAAA